MAGPFTAAITSLRTSHAGGSNGDAVNDASGTANASDPIDMSAPELNARPAPVTTTTRTWSSASHDR